MANEVLLTDLVYGGKKNEDGTKTAERASAGDSVPSGLSADEKQALKDAGVIGNPAELYVTLGSTTSVTQSAEWPTPERTEQLVNAEPASDEQIKIALRARTDEVARAEGSDPEKVVEAEEKAAAKADEAAAKDTPKATRAPTVKE